MTVIGTIEATGTGIEEVDIVQTRKEGIEAVPGIIVDVAEAEGIDIRRFRCRFSMCNIPLSNVLVFDRWRNKVAAFTKSTARFQLS